MQKQHLYLVKKKQFIIDKVSVRAVCIDDFALKKSVSYGTIMVDIDTHRIIDIIPSRGSLEVENWLRSFPNLKVISRDGSKTYASAIQKSHPDIIQISDRFHLIKGLSEVIRKYIIREFPARVEIPLTATISPEMQLLYNIGNRSQRIKFAHQKRKEGLTVNDIALLLHSAPTTIRKYLAIPEEDIPEDKQTTPQKRHELAMQQKKKEVEEARMLSKEGYPIEQIASMMKHTYKTIQNYLDPRYSIVNGHYNVRIPGKLAPYEQEVVELRSQGMTYPKIHAIVSEKGYSGSVASLRSFMKKERTRVREQDEFSKQKEFIPRKSLCQLIYRKIENVPTITKLQYEETLKKYPLLSNLYTLVKEFYEILFSKKAENIKSWIALAQEYDIPELQTFIAGISYDLVAVKNGITYSYNNVLAEGSVNKIKLIKRTMYGRNSFELLKSKVLYHELFQTKFN